MYNEVVKQSFIKDYMRSRVVMQTTLTGLFNKVERFETEKCKDCCEFNLDEILEMFSRFDARSVNVLENSVTYLRAYGNYMVYHQHTIRTGNMVCRQGYNQRKDIYLPLGQNGKAHGRTYSMQNREPHPFPLDRR